MGKESSSKSHSSKPVKAHASRHKSSSGRHRTHDPSSSSNGHALSFLFAISEIGVVASEVDTWGNIRPPTSPGSYDQREDLQTPVMRYCDGTIIDVSQTYWWGRDHDTGVGAIYYYSEPHTTSYQTVTYSQATICCCHPLLPFAVVNTDATIYETQVMADGDGINELTWEPLRFFFPLGADGTITGVSQAVFTCSLGPDSPGGATRTHVAGRNPSWLRSLVPPTYENHSPAAPRSQGLGGNLAILLGLMAFSAPGGREVSRASTVSQRWRNRRWHSDRASPSYNKSASDAPQHLVVTIALDPDNPMGSREDDLERFECRDVAVREST